MSSRKERRRAKKQSDALRAEAWRAAARGRLDLARRRLEQAIEDGPGNARLWLDRGRLARLAGDAAAAESAARRALELSPTYAEAHELLLELLVARGAGEEAVALEERRLARERAAGRLRPGDEGSEAGERRLAELRARFAIASPAERAAELDALGTDPDPARTERYRWPRIAAELDGQGWALLPGLLSADELAELADLAEGDRRETPYERTLALEPAAERTASGGTPGAAGGGRAVRRVLRPPLPPLVVALRRELYARALPIARDWARRWSAVGEALELPARLEGFLELCRRAGQERAGIALLRLPAGGPEVRLDAPEARVRFPLVLEVELGPAGTRGVLADVRSDPLRRLRRRRPITPRPGDGVLRAARERPVPIGGVPARQPVVRLLRAGGQAPGRVLSIPFEDEP